MFGRILLALGRFGVFLIPFIIGVVIVFGWFRSNFAQPFEPGSERKVHFLVNPNSNIKTIARQLEEQKLLKNWWSVYYLSKFKTSGPDGKLDIHVGEYELSDGYTPAKILDVLLSKEVVQHQLTVVEGLNVDDIGKLMAKTSLVSEEDAKRALTDRALMTELDIPALTPEGYLFPETYFFSRPITAADMVRRIVLEGRQKVDKKLPRWKDRAREIGLSEYQVLTLASIVEKETGKAEERPVIASVFHNRLRIGMPLQSDPTVIYGIPNFNGNITKEDLKTPGPYNTYLNTGLPPTPIASPGIDSIKAVLNPEDTDFLYFVSRGDGSHHFSKTYKEHSAAVQNFQKSGS